MILVTGASGAIGSALVRRLVSGEQPVRALVHNPAKAAVHLADVRDRIEIVPGDVTQPRTLRPALDGARAVVHLVAIAMEKGRATYEAVNTQGTVNLVDAAQAAGVRRFVNMSQNGADSALAYPFLRSKGKAQDYVAASGLEWTAFRPSVVWGPRDEFANVQARLIRLTPLVFPIVGDGMARFQPVYVGDLVEAIARSVDDDATIGRELEIGGPEVLTYEQIVRRVLAALGTRRVLVRVPVPLLRPVVAIMARLPNPPVTPSLLDLLKIDNVVEHNALVDHFGIAPRPFTPEFLDYMRRFTAGDSLKRFFGRSTSDGPEGAR